MIPFDLRPIQRLDREEPLREAEGCAAAAPSIARARVLLVDNAPGLGPT